MEQEFHIQVVAVVVESGVGQAVRLWCIHDFSCFRIGHSATQRTKKKKPLLCQRRRPSDSLYNIYRFDPSPSHSTFHGLDLRPGMP